MSYVVGPKLGAVRRVRSIDRIVNPATERRPMSEILAFQAILFVCGTIAFVATLRFLRRFLELRHEKLLLPPDGDRSERLARIEATVESTAVEVERIAEASRFLAKILSDRGTPTPPLAKPPERVITPH